MNASYDNKSIYTSQIKITLDIQQLNIKMEKMSEYSARMEPCEENSEQ